MNNVVVVGCGCVEYANTYLTANLPARISRNLTTRALAASSTRSRPQVSRISTTALTAIVAAEKEETLCGFDHFF